MRFSPLAAALVLSTQGCGTPDTASPADAPVAEEGLATTIIDGAIAFHGALDARDTLRFTKRSHLYDSTGATERDTTGAYAIATAPLRAGATDAERAAHFTATLPWRLRDEGAVLTVLADTTVFGRVVHAVRADYPGGGDPWTHYFEVGTGRHAGYFVDHGGRDALVENRRDTTVAGLVLPAERETTRVEAGAAPWLRGRFGYRYTSAQ